MMWKLGVWVLVVGGLLACSGSREMRRLEVENALLRAQLDSDNSVLDSQLRDCHEQRVALEVACVADRVSLGELTACPGYAEFVDGCWGAECDGCIEACPEPGANPGSPETGAP